MRKTPLLSRLWAYRLFTLAAFAAASQAVAVEAGGAERARLHEKLNRVEIPFVANTGLHDPAVAFSASTFEGAAFVTRKGQIVYSLSSGAKGSPGWTLTETPVTSRALRPVGNESSETCVSYFLGDDPAQWQANVETHRSVLIGTAWSGISLELRAHGNSIEKLFTVEPGADVSRIRMRMDGAKSLRVQRDGSLLLATGLGQARFTAPIAYQEIGGVRHAVSVRYRVRGSSYGFVLGDYDPDVAVVIDPILQSTYLGGSLIDAALALAIHPTSGEVYAAGSTNSFSFPGVTPFPGTAGGAQPASGGNTDAFVARLNATLTTLAQATYLGGSSDDNAYALAIHPSSGEVYVTGRTSSGNFPGTPGGAQPVFGGSDRDAFVARLSASLTLLVQATYLGGDGNEEGFGLALNPAGEPYVAGFTTSSNFPGTAGGAQPTKSGAEDAFIARLTASLTTPAQASYLGGTGNEAAVGVAIHPTSGEVYVAGETDSTDLPGTTGGAQPAFVGGQEAFLARFTADLTLHPQVTYLGGGDNDAAAGLAIHPTSGEVYVAGGSSSPDFPGTAGGAQPTSGGGASDAFVARLTASLTTLPQSTYLGGSSDDAAVGVAIHPTSGEVYVTGGTASSNLPGTTGGAQPTSGGGASDAFVARLTASLTTLPQSTYLGGSGSSPESAVAVAIHPTSGEVYVTGGTGSSNFPVTTGGAQPSIGGFLDAFVARLTADLAGAPPPGLPFFTVTPCRAIDTRDPDGPFGGPVLDAGASRAFIIAGRCNIPVGARAVFGNVTIVGPTAPGHLSIHPAGTPLPVVSTINFQPGQTRANNGIFPLGTNGGIAVADGQSAGTVHFILDVAGYF